MSIRKDIYYWKSDRPNAFTHLREDRKIIYDSQTAAQLRSALALYFGSQDFVLKSAGGQGNHLTYLMEFEDKSYFLRLEKSEEKDDYMQVEAEIISRVSSLDVPVPGIYHVDVNHIHVPFSYQIMEHLPFPDLNKIKKSGNLDMLKIAGSIGINIAKWQALQMDGFGPFDTTYYSKYAALKGYHKTYRDYYHLNLDMHLHFLQESGFLSQTEQKEIKDIIRQNDTYLHLEKACLVHKDLALWNLLGTDDELKAVIDWGDAIAGDPTDDISLLACFYENDILNEVISGYQCIKPLPEAFYPRFYLHLLRNILVKAVIRVGGGYFEKNEDFFLIDSKMKGDNLEEFTKARIHIACQNLKNQVEHLQL